MQFRPLAKRDLPALAQMYTYYALHTVYTYYCYPASASYMGELFKGRGHLCAVATEEDCAIGYVHIAPSFSFSRKRCTVAVYLQPEFTNRGIGPQLVQSGESMARSFGYQIIRAGVCSENVRSQAMFMHLGYAYAGEKKNDGYKFQRPLDTRYYEKDLTLQESSHA